MSASAQGRLFLFEWNEEAALRRTTALATAGWQVDLEFEDGARGCRNCKAFAPDAVVLDLAVKPSHSREVGRALRQTKATQEVPLIYVGGSEGDIEKTREKLPDAMFATSRNLMSVLGRVPRKELVA